MLKKKDLVKRVASMLGDSQAHVEGILDTTFEEIIKILQDGEELYIHGFGKFGVKTTNEMTKVTPVGTTVTIPSRVKPTFKFFDSVKNVF